MTVGTTIATINIECSETTDRGGKKQNSELNAIDTINHDPREYSREQWEHWGYELKSPLKAIRQKCLECVGRVPKEVRLCTVTKCPLFALRMGSKPRPN